MSVVALISDMHGRAGDLRYLDDWTRVLSARGHRLRVVFIDDLLPEHDEAVAESEQARHARITAPEAVAAAHHSLADCLMAISPQIVLGCSYGGYLLAGMPVRAGLDVKRLCISATRLRLLLPLFAPPRVLALFGADDPNKPDCSSAAKTGPYLRAIDIPGRGHDLYRDAATCAPWLDQIGATSRALG